MFLNIFSFYLKFPHFDWNFLPTLLKTKIVNNEHPPKKRLMMNDCG